MSVNFPYSREDEYAPYSRTPLGIVNVFLAILRERFSLDKSGQDNGFNWAPTPTIGDTENYKESELYIEKWGSVNVQVSNFAPAIIVKRAALQYTQLVIEDMMEGCPHSDRTWGMGQVHSGISISCYSRAEAECEILANMVFEFFVRTRWIIQEKFIINNCVPRMLTEVQILPETSQEDNRLYKADVQLELIYDFNHDWLPMAPVLKEIYGVIEAEGAHGAALLDAFLIY